MLTNYGLACFILCTEKRSGLNRILFSSQDSISHNSVHFPFNDALEKSIAESSECTLKCHIRISGNWKAHRRFKISRNTQQWTLAPSSFHQLNYKYLLFRVRKSPQPSWMSFFNCRRWLKCSTETEINHVQSNSHRLSPLLGKSTIGPRTKQWRKKKMK